MAVPAILLTEILIAALFAASLHFLTGLAGMTSFGHAAWFGLGAYGAALLLKLGALPMEAALLLGPLAAALGALVFGWFCVRLSGVCHADAGRGADPVGHRLPVGRRHRRQQRTHRPVARRG